MKHPGSWYVVRCPWLVLLAGLAMPALGAPRAQSAEECYLFSDVAIVARGLSLEQVPEATADRVLGHIYSQALTVTSTNGHERFVVLIGSIAKAARRQDGAGALGFAQRLYKTCLVHGGDMNEVLGGET